MKKTNYLITVIILLFSVISYCATNDNIPCRIPLTKDLIKKCIKLEDKITEFNNETEKAEAEYNEKLAKEEKEYKEDITKLEEKYKDDIDKLTEEKEKLGDKYKEKVEKIIKDYNNKESKFQKEEDKIEEEKDKLEEEINKTLRTKGYNIVADIDNDILFHIYPNTDGKKGKDILADYAQKVTREVTTTGFAAVINDDYVSARDKAITDAQVKALEQVLGVFIEAETQASDFTNVKEKISKNVKGYIESCVEDKNKDKIETIEGGKLLYVTCNCVVNVNQVFDTIKSIKGLYERIGKPKFIVYASSSGNTGFNFAPIIEAAFMQKLQDWNFDSVDSSVLDLKYGELSDGNIKSYYSQLKDHGVKLAFFVSAQVLDSQSKIIDQAAIDAISDQIGPWGSFAAGFFNKKRNTFSNINVKLVDIKSGTPIYNNNFKREKKQAFKISDKVTNEIVKDGLYDFFHGESSSEMRNKLFNRWADIASQNVVNLTIENIGLNDIESLKEEIKSKERFFVRFDNEKYENGTLSITIYNNCKFDIFFNTLKSIKLNTGFIEVVSYDPNEETIKAQYTQNLEEETFIAQKVDNSTNTITVEETVVNIEQIDENIPEDLDKTDNPFKVSNNNIVLAINNNPKVKVTGIKLDKLSVLISKDKIYQLEATIIPKEATNKKVFWITSNPNIVQVSNTGQIKGLKKGTAVITVVSQEGIEENKCKISSCKVTVK